MTPKEKRLFYFILNFIKGKAIYFIWINYRVEYAVFQTMRCYPGVYEEKIS